MHDWRFPAYRRQQGQSALAASQSCAVDGLSGLQMAMPSAIGHAAAGHPAQK
jgi:hypothetical protein